MKLTTHLHLVPMLRKSVAVPLIPIYALMTWTGEKFTFSCCKLSYVKRNQLLCTWALSYRCWWFSRCCLCALWSRQLRGVCCGEETFCRYAQVTKLKSWFFWNGGRLRLKCDGTRAETRFRLSEKRTSPFKSARASVQSTTGSRRVRISGSNAGYTIFRSSVKSTGYPLLSPVSPSILLPCVTVCHHMSTALYISRNLYLLIYRKCITFISDTFSNVSCACSRLVWIYCSSLWWWRWYFFHFAAGARLNRCLRTKGRHFLVHVTSERH